MEYDDEVTKSIQLIRAGKKAEAQLILEPYIQANPQDIQAWMWETEIFPADCDKMKVLEICLEHNPNHPQVLQALEIIRNRSGIPQEIPAIPEPAYNSAYAEPVPVESDAASVPVEATPSSPKTAGPKSEPRPIQIKRKHPDWPEVIGTVDVSQVGVSQRSRSTPMYYSDIRAYYAVDGRDFTVKFPGKTSFSSFDPQVITSNYPPGTNITVCYDPKRPQRAWVDEWDSGVIKEKLKRFKAQPKIRQALARSYKSRMISGIWWTLGGIAATIVATMIFSKLGYAYVAFGGAIVYGLYCLISGLVGWLGHLK